VPRMKLPPGYIQNEDSIRKVRLSSEAKATESYVETPKTLAALRAEIASGRLKAADLAAKRHKVNRSALIRDALREHLKRLHDLELEARDRRGFMAQPQREEEFLVWEDASAWPEN